MLVGSLATYTLCYSQRGMIPNGRMRILDHLCKWICLMLA
jgi:hypothetical protein